MSAGDDFEIPLGLRNERGHLAALFQSLAPEIRKDLGAISHVKQFKAGEIVVSDGHVQTELGYIIDGTLAMTKVLPDGRTHIIGLLVPTDMYGRVFEDISSYHIAALTDTSVFCFERGPFEQILRRVPEIERLFLVNVLDELDAAREWILMLGGHKAGQRLASFLLILCRRKTRQVPPERVKTASAITIHIGIRRADLAHYLGARPETLSRAFHQMEKAKILKIVDAYTFQILDLNGLIELAGHDLVTSPTQPGP
ncbi:MAG: Crp/Fnr family transcriptional regulator [Paracoccaceae bacterium]